MRYLGCCLVVSTIWMAVNVWAQENPAPSDKETAAENAAKAAEFAAAEAQRYDIRSADAARGPLKLVSKPLLRWSNPTVGEVHGSVVLWTDRGCPAAAASIYRFFHRPQINVILEWKSVEEAAKD